MDKAPNILIESNIICRIQATTTCFDFCLLIPLCFYFCFSSLPTCRACIWGRKIEFSQYIWIFMKSSSNATFSDVTMIENVQLICALVTIDLGIYKHPIFSNDEILINCRVEIRKLTYKDWRFTNLLKLGKGPSKALLPNKLCTRKRLYFRFSSMQRAIFTIFTDGLRSHDQDLLTVWQFDPSYWCCLEYSLLD